MKRNFNGMTWEESEQERERRAGIKALRAVARYGAPTADPRNELHYVHERAEGVFEATDGKLFLRTPTNGLGCGKERFLPANAIRTIQEKNQVESVKDGLMVSDRWGDVVYRSATEGVWSFPDFNQVLTSERAKGMKLVVTFAPKVLLRLAQAAIDAEAKAIRIFGDDLSRKHGLYRFETWPIGDEPRMTGAIMAFKVHEAEGDE